MKGLLIVIAICSSVTLSVIHGQDEEIQGDGLTNIGNHPQVDVCVSICFAEKPDPELEMFFGNLGHPMQIKYIHKILVPQILSKYCEHVNETWTCLEQCKPSLMKDVFSQAFSPLSYMCIESDFLKYAACYKKVYDRMETPCCNNPKRCGLLRLEVEQNFAGQRQQKVVDETNKQFIEKVVSSICDYADCANRCRRPAIEQTCGQEASNILNRWYSKMVEALNQSQVFFGINIETPRKCFKVGSDGSY